MKKIFILITLFLFSCDKSIKLDSISNHKKSVLLDKYAYGSLKTSILVLKKNNKIYKIKVYNINIKDLKIKDTIK